MREPFTTSVICATTAACPERVWQALVCPSENLGVPAGLEVVSEWRPGSPVRLAPAGCDEPRAEMCAFGEVIASVPPLRLSYMLGAGPDGADFTTIVTWTIGPDAGGCTVTLTVDDLASCGADGPDGAPAWHDVVSTLARALDRGAHPEGTATER